MMTPCCLQDDRRDAVRQRQGWNGLDYVELAEDGQTLRAFFLGKLPPELAGPSTDAITHLRIEGGDVITGIAITNTQAVVDADPEHDDMLLVTLDRIGDFSTYTLRLTDVANLDPLYDRADFAFRPDCPRDIDCAPVCDCPAPVLDEPEIDYLAKDYASFRQLVLDRMALLVPDWCETHAPDLGIALVELLAYTGDYLSYYQDAVGTEAYLQTARQRISIRRHARLVDYRLHEGCNARTFVCVTVDTDIELDSASVSFITGLNSTPGDQRTVITWNDLAGVASDTYRVFEPLYRSTGQKISLRAAHSEIRFHTFGRRLCCLEQGSTGAALLDTGLVLAPGDLLIFEEVRGKQTGLPEDADPTRRHAVRLTAVTAKEDPIVRGPDDTPTHYLWVEWGQADALPFPFCLSAIGEAPGCAYIDNISVAHGNVVVVDHGQTQPPEDLGAVPVVDIEAPCACAELPGLVSQTPGLYRPSLMGYPLTWRQPPASDTTTPAAMLLTQVAHAAMPQLWLTSQPAANWTVRNDLVDSTADDADFVAEIDNQGIAHLRFGDGDLGLMPAAGTEFTATYRVGNGIDGNVGAEAICRLVLSGTTLSGVSISLRNPLPAVGGTEPESVDQAILLAPNMFRTRLERAITADDYAAIAGRDPRLQRAAAALVWTGSWYEADVAVDPLGGERAPPALLTEIQHQLWRYRRIGHDLSVRPAEYVSIDLGVAVCVLPHYRRAEVKAALLDVFSNRVLPDGGLGFFHPDRLTFGEGVFLSRIVAAAQAVPGVEYAEVTRLQRRFEAPNHEIENGLLPVQAWEIARLDNDPNHPERGRLDIQVRGGR
jgi:hypothetical protein